MTETELVLMSLTDEELLEAARFMGWCHDRWRESRRALEAQRIDGDYATEGPLHALRALDLAIVREQAVRGGAEPWYAGMSLVGHPGASRIRHYQERIALNPDQGILPRLSEAGILERVCPGCGQAKPLTVAFWGWQDSSLAPLCRACARPDPAAIRAALVDAQDAQEPASAAVAPFAADELEPVATGEGWAL